jgi:catechol 2,3-dioxygenase-like lactoylglutathione lyase family enzyme
MTYLGVTHVAVEVPTSLRDAEALYSRLFDLRVSWREPVPAGAPFDLPWADLDAAGCAPTVVMLHAGAFRLALERAGGATRGGGPITHVGLQVTAGQLRAVRERARAAGCSVIAERDGELFDFVDPYGVEWELDTRSFDDPRAIVAAKRPG